MANVNAMLRRPASLLLALAIAVVGLPTVQAVAQAPPPPTEITVMAGYGEADATWHVGASAGQYAQDDAGNVVNSVSQDEVDPHGHAIKQRPSYGVQSRLSYRAIVVEDGAGDQVAFVKSDGYIAMDYLARRAGQILQLAESDVSYEEIFHMVSHNHSSPYYMTPSPGPWVFQDAFDIRAFEYHARALAQAIMNAEDNLVPARMGATTVDHKLFKGTIQRKGISDDGTPRGYPDDFGDYGLSVIRFDDMTDPAQPTPLATLINWGQHPESLDGYDLITAEFVGHLERIVERETGAPLVFGQGDVGSAEAGPGRPELVAAMGIPARWSHAGHAQAERGAYLLSRDVIKGWQQIADPTASPLVPYSSDFDVAAGNAFVAGPYSHPYPAANSCRTETTLEGQPGAGSAADCTRGPKLADPDPLLWEKLKEAGVPIPDNYDTPSYFALEENTRLHLQAFKMGEVILASCACEAQVDLILNFESRANEVQGDIWDGFDWTAENVLPQTKEVLPARMICDQANPPDGDWTCVENPNDERKRAVIDSFTATDYEYRRMKAQIHNDAAGWDDPQNVSKAQSEPFDTTQIFGNFTKEELSPEAGYKLAIGVGHAGDYNGYTVSYREFQSWDDYRKALTSYGPHTADYMTTRMVQLAAKLNGFAQPELETDIQRGLPDEGRQLAMSTALGATSMAAYEAWQAALPLDKGPVGALPDGEGQPKDINRFDAATFKWRGGSNAVDNPVVNVERMEDGAWVPFADQSGEVQTRVRFPNGVNAFASTYSGNQEWIWTANFEAFDAFPAGIGSTPPGEYRFVVEGKYRAEPAADATYEVTSEPFTVSRWDGVKVRGVTVNTDRSVSFNVDPIDYPSSYPADNADKFPYIVDALDKGDELGKPFCTRCSFRPWANGAHLAESRVTVLGSDGSRAGILDVDCTPASEEKPNEPVAYSCVTNGVLPDGQKAVIFPGDVADTYGETVATCVDETGEIECPPEPTVSPTPTDDDDDQGEDDDDGGSRPRRPRRPSSSQTPGDQETLAGGTRTGSKLTFTDQSATAGQYSDKATFEAKLVDDAGKAIANAGVTFELVGSEGTKTFPATTNDQGLARVSPRLDQEPGSLQLNARFAGDGLTLGSADTTSFVVEEEGSRLTFKRVTGRRVVAKLTDIDSPDAGLADRRVALIYQGRESRMIRSNERGRITFRIPRRYRGEGLVAKLIFSGDEFFKGTKAKTQV